MTEAKSPIQGWAILELMGHRKLGGLIEEAEIAGASFIRIDVPGESEEIIATQFYSASAIYCITPTTEDMARAVAIYSRPEPVSRWELPPGSDERDSGFDEDQPEPVDVGEVL